LAGRPLAARAQLRREIINCLYCKKSQACADGGLKVGWKVGRSLDEIVVNARGAFGMDMRYTKNTEPSGLMQRECGLQA